MPSLALLSYILLCKRSRDVIRIRQLTSPTSASRPGNSCLVNWPYCKSWDLRQQKAVTSQYPQASNSGPLRLGEKEDDDTETSRFTLDRYTSLIGGLARRDVG